MIKALGNKIVFQFVERVNNSGQFERQQSSGGIVLVTNFDDSAKSPRWGKIVSVGPKVSAEFSQPNIEILIAPLRWTEACQYQGEKYWKTDETQILGYRIVE